MVVTCPKCKIKLKVDETRLSPEGSKFKCPKCSTVLVVKKPGAAPAAPKSLNGNTVLVAHTNPALLQTMVSLLSGAGFNVITANDGIDLMVKALKEFPFLGIIEVALPKIYGFEVCKRLKSRVETRDMKFILIPAIHDKTKYRREPTSLYGADDYIEEFDVPVHLLSKINTLRGMPDEEKTEEPPKPPQKDIPLKNEAPEPKAPPRQEPVSRPVTEIKRPAPAAEQKGPDERIEKARRLARTIVNDIYLYNTAKVDTAIRSGDFYAAFAAEIKEGKKLYDGRIPQEVRQVQDYYREAIDNFIAAKKGA
ncbi:MAG: zinc-ribbon domain-containing protein [Thermodesulfovibrionales bacterium]